MSEEELLKERILSAAFDRFRTDGFARVSIDDIASSLVMSKKTFYKFFASKDDLIEQLVDRLLADVKAHVERIVSSDQTFVAKLSALLSYLGSLPAHAGLPMLNDLQRHAPHLWKRVEQFRLQRIPDIFSRLLKQGIREGHVRPDLHQRIFLLSYMAAVQLIMQPSVLANESFSAREAISGIMELFFKGALTDRGRKQLAKVQIHPTLTL